MEALRQMSAVAVNVEHREWKRNSQSLIRRRIVLVGHCDSVRRSGHSDWVYIRLLHSSKTKLVVHALDYGASNAYLIKPNSFDPNPQAGISRRLNTSAT